MRETDRRDRTRADTAAPGRRGGGRVQLSTEARVPRVRALRRVGGRDRHSARNWHCLEQPNSQGRAAWSVSGLAGRESRGAGSDMAGGSPRLAPIACGVDGAAARLPGRRATHAKAMTAPGHPKLASIATAGLIRPAVRLVVFVASSSSAGRVITRPTRRRKSWTSRDPVALRPDGRQSGPIRPFRREGPPGPGSPGPATSRHDAARAPGPCPPPSVSAGLGCLRTPSAAGERTVDALARASSAPLIHGRAVFNRRGP